MTMRLFNKFYYVVKLNIRNKLFSSKKKKKSKFHNRRTILLFICFCMTIVKLCNINILVHFIELKLITANI